MTFKLPSLPYGHDALAPFISAETLRLHHQGHHKTYVDKLNAQLKGKDMADKPLIDVVKWSAAAESRRPIFNNAGQAWNHAFYWHSLRPVGGEEPGNKLATEIKKAFGDLDGLRKALVQAGESHFGSGWVWLVCDRGNLKVITTHDAGTPIISGQRPLLTIDVWEHAYYVDYRNRRAEHLAAVTEHLLNWDYAESNFIMTEEATEARA
jgi:Fe-Mn family superoxide dismutase